MATRYRLPEDVFDGGEYEGTRTTFAGEPWVLFALGDVRFYVEESALTEVKPLPPEEPPNFSTVRIGSRAYVRDDLSDHLNWYGPDGRKTWAELVAKSMESTGLTPVLLVPDPFAGRNLLTKVGWPWEVVTGYGTTVGTQPLDTGRVNVWIRPPHTATAVATIDPGVARVLAEALTEAARQAAEKEQQS